MEYKEFKLPVQLRVSDLREIVRIAGDEEFVPTGVLYLDFSPLTKADLEEVARVVKERGL